MHRRLLLAGLVLALIGAAVAAIAQSPAPPATAPTTPPPVVIVPPAEPIPPGPPRALPAAPVTPQPSNAAAPAASQLARFEPLAAFPHQTQSAVRAVLMGANWMTRMSQAQGRFMPGYNPALKSAPRRSRLETAPRRSRVAGREVQRRRKRRHAGKPGDPCTTRLDQDRSRRSKLPGADSFVGGMQSRWLLVPTCDGDLRTPEPGPEACR